MYSVVSLVESVFFYDFCSQAITVILFSVKTSSLDFSYVLLFFNYCVNEGRIIIFDHATFAHDCNNTESDFLTDRNHMFS